MREDQDQGLGTWWCWSREAGDSGDGAGSPRGQRMGGQRQGGGTEGSWSRWEGDMEVGAWGQQGQGQWGQGVWDADRDKAGDTGTGRGQGRMGTGLMPM